MKLNSKCFQIILDHSRPVKVILWEEENFQDITFSEQKTAELLNHFADIYPDSIFLWHEVSLNSYIKPTSIFQMLSGPFDVLHCSGLFRSEALLATLGYVDFLSPFLLLEGNTRFPSWLITGQMGITHAALFRILKLRTDCSFIISLLEWGYEGQKYGFCCYSEPNSFFGANPPFEEIIKISSNANHLNQAQLIKRIYGFKWILFWALVTVLDGKWRDLSLLFLAFFSSRPKAFVFNQRLLEERINFRDSENIYKKTNVETVDVILPTLDRLEHVKNVMFDLSRQSVLPNQVIIIEQAPSDITWSPIPLDFGKEYSFEIVKKTVPWTGVCRARNLGLSICKSKWVLFLDDDIRFGNKFIEDLLKEINLYKVLAINAGTYLENQPMLNSQPAQIWNAFGGGIGLVDRDLANKIGGFDETIIGYGEDSEFGVRLRKTGSHILYTTKSPVLHLKAVRGGFRNTKHVPLPWAHEKIQPRPSPTILYAYSKHNTIQMKRGFQLFTFINRIKSVPLSKWLTEYRLAKRQWLVSDYWATWLAK